MAFPENTNPVFGDSRAITFKKILARLNDMTALPGGGAVTPPSSAILLEDGSYLLAEDGSYITTEI